MAGKLGDPSRPGPSRPEQDAPGAAGSPDAALPDAYDADASDARRGGEPGTDSRDPTRPTTPVLPEPSSDHALRALRNLEAMGTLQTTWCTLQGGGRYGMAECQHLARDGLRVRVQRLKTTSGDVWAQYFIAGQRNDTVYQLPVRHFVPTDIKWTPPARAAPSVGPFLRKPTAQELTPLAEAATCSTADQMVLDFMLAGLDATRDAAVVAEIRRMHVARKWHEFQRKPAAFARYWAAHLVGTLRKGYLVYEDFGATVIPSPVQRDRAATQAGTADLSRGLFANYHPPCSEKEGYTRRDNGGSTCITNRVHQRAVETTTGHSAPLESLFDGFGDYAPFAHALTIEIDGEWVNFDPHVHAYGALTPARRLQHDEATVAMYRGMFEDEILLRGRVGMLAIVMGRNADVLLWPLLQKAAAQASGATRKPYELRRPEVTPLPLPPPKKKPRDWQPERFRLKHSSRAFDMTMDCRLQWDEATAFAQQGRLPAEVNYFRGLAKGSKWGAMFESERRQLLRDAMAVGGGWEGPSPLQGNWDELSMRKEYEAAVSIEQKQRKGGGTKVEQVIQRSEKRKQDGVALSVLEAAEYEAALAKRAKSRSAAGTTEQLREAGLAARGYTPESRAEELAQVAAEADRTGKQPKQAELRGLYAQLQGRMRSLPPQAKMRISGGDAKMWEALVMAKAGKSEADILQSIRAA